jgi:transposase
MASRYVNVDRETAMLLPPDLKEWVAGNDLVHFVVEAVGMCDMGKAQVNSRGTGDRQYPPSMMLALLIYSYATGTFSSRGIERQSYESVAVRYVCANTHPDHDTIAKFRRENEELIHECFVKVLELAREMGLLRLGAITMDGTKIKARAARKHTLESRELEREVRRCLQEARRADESDDPSAGGTLLPAELGTPCARLARLREAQQRLAARQIQRDQDPPRPGSGPPRVNTTDPDSALQPTAQGSFIQGYNAQLCTTSEGVTFIVACRVTASTNDRQQMAANVEGIDPRLGCPDTILSDTGFDNSSQIHTLQSQGLQVLCPPQNGPPRAAGRPVRRSAARQAVFDERAKRRALMDSPEGRRLYNRRTPSIEPVFHVLKNILGFGRFSLRGLKNVSLEWKLLALAFNCRKLAAQPA